MESAFSFLVNTRALLRAVRHIKHYIPAREKACVKKSVWLSVENGRLCVELNAEARIAQFLPVEKLFVVKPHPVAVEAELFIKVLSRCPEEVHINFSDNTFRVMTANTIIALPYIGPEWFASVAGSPVPSSAAGLAKIVDAVAEVLPSASMDPDMDAIHCVHFALTPGVLRVEAMNGHMYQCVHVELDASTSAVAFALNGVMLPYPYAKRLTKTIKSGFLGDGLTVTVGILDRWSELHIFGQSGSMSLPLYRREYPNTDVFIQRRNGVEGRITVNVKDVVSALGMMLPSMKTYDRGVSFTALPDSLRLATRSECGTNSAFIVPFKVEGKLPWPFVVPAEQLMGLIARVSEPGDEILLELTGHEGPCFVSASSKPESLGIIMPLKVADNYELPEGVDKPVRAEADQKKVA